ncbi:MAG: pyridoxamine 5'-phosphate oxidase family protein [Bacteroidota bacterium]
MAMLTTVDKDGSLRSRPMSVQEEKFDGTLWFFTQDNSPKAGEIKREHEVNVSFAKPEDNRYVSVSGKATISHDKEKMKKFWNPAYKAWFPKGLDDPNICLLKINVEKAEYWDSPGSAVIHLIGFVKALATGEEYEPGENEKITL